MKLLLYRFTFHFTYKSYVKQNSKNIVYEKSIIKLHILIILLIFAT